MTLSETVRWWDYGNYVPGDCPNCGRQRLLQCEDPSGKERIICDKCDWEPARNNYRASLHPKGGAE